MASLVKWSPFHDLMTLQRDVNRLFSDVGFSPPSAMAEGETDLFMPAMDVFARGEDLVIRAELPGISPENLEISVTDDILTLSAERRAEHEVQEEDYLVRETSWGTMKRTLRIPSGAAVDSIHADYSDGIVEVTVPGGAPKTGRTRKIEIETHEPGRLTGHH